MSIFYLIGSIALIYDPILFFYGLLMVIHHLLWVFIIIYTIPLTIIPTSLSIITIGDPMFLLDVSIDGPITIHYLFFILIYGSLWVYCGFPVASVYFL